ncbi:MAG: hypothetical protein H7175_28375, partial [Burkholderiales bacterium]|nr:hypothetical protein [Anaerolineae bacterium]
GRASGGSVMGGQTPALTIGALLLRLRRLHALADSMSPTQRTLLEKVEARHNAIRDEWSVHYQQKLVKEGESRLKGMDAFFKECLDEPRTCYSGYPPEAMRRTIIQEIDTTLDAMNASSAELDRQIKRADSKLQGIIKPSEFIWAKALESVYPRDTYWWLYSRPPKT